MQAGWASVHSHTESEVRAEATRRKTTLREGPGEISTWRTRWREEALAGYDQALSRDPAVAAAAGNRAYPLHTLGRVAEAEAAER
jgi:hypothetical protein